MSPSDVESILFSILIVLLLVFSAFYSASEIAFSSANNVRIMSLAEEKKRGARKALYIQKHFNEALSAILVGNNFVNILSTTLCASLFLRFISSPIVYNLVNTVVMTIIILIFGEILPKAAAKANPEKAALFLAPMLYVIMKITYIFCLPFNALQKVFSKKKKDLTITKNELDSIVETMEDEGVIKKDNAEIIFGALKFSDVEVKDIMTPRVDVVCVTSQAGVEEVNKLFLKYQYSRLPVYEKTKDNIIGVLNQKDVFLVMAKDQKLNIKEVMASPIFVSTSTKASEAMRLMQKEKMHLAVVIDEYGGTSGIVTLEDCYEEIFGEVYDEHDDKIDFTIEKLKDDTYKINAETTLEDLFDYLKIEKMPEEKYSTLSTFLSDLLGRVPEQNAKISYDIEDEILGEDGKFLTKKLRLNFKLTKVVRRRILEVELCVKYIK